MASDLIEQMAAPNSLTKAKDGIWYAAQTDAISYPDEASAAHFTIEDQSFWYQHRNNCIVELIKAFPWRGKCSVTLDYFGEWP